MSRRRRSLGASVEARREGQAARGDWDLPKVGLVEVGLLSDHTARSNRLLILGVAAIPAFALAGWGLSGVAAVIASGLAFGIPLAAFLAAVRRYTRTEDGERLRAEAARYLNKVRSNIEEARVRMEEPLWLESAVGRDEDMAVAAALIPLYLAVILGGPTRSGGIARHVVSPGPVPRLGLGPPSGSAEEAGASDEVPSGGIPPGGRTPRFARPCCEAPLSLSLRPSLAFGDEGGQPLLQ